MKEEEKYQETIKRLEEHIVAEIHYGVIRWVIRIFSILLALFLIIAGYYLIKYKPFLKENPPIEEKSLINEPDIKENPPIEKKAKMETIKFGSEIAESFEVVNEGFFSTAKTTLRVQLLELGYSSANFFTSPEVVLKVTVCNVGDQGIPIFRLYFWYTSFNQEWTMHWESEYLDHFKPGECRTLSMLSEALDEQIKLNWPLGIMYISLDRDTIYSKIDLNKVQRRQSNERGERQDNGKPFN